MARPPGSRFVPILTGRCRCGRLFRPSKQQQKTLLKPGRWCHCSRPCRKKKWSEPAAYDPYKAPCFDTTDYSDAQSEWLREILRLRKKLKRPPTLLEAFALAKRMGYRREEYCDTVRNTELHAGEQSTGV
jgi:hypothetical protein